MHICDAIVILFSLNTKLNNNTIQEYLISYQHVAQIIGSIVVSFLKAV